MLAVPVLDRLGVARGAVLGLMGALATAGCAGEGARAADPAVRDSAGIRIVENPTELPSSLSWSALEEVSIGSVDGSEAETFNQVAELAVAKDGRVYVLDSGDNVVKVYDAAGAHVITFGGEGEGPEEFQGASRLMVRGDSVVVFDVRLMKLAHFDGDGELLGTVRSQLTVFDHGFPIRMIPRGDGFVVVLATGCSLPAPEDRRPKWKVLAVDGGGGVQDTVALEVDPGALAIYGDRFCSSVNALAPRRHSLAVRADGLTAYGDGDRYEIRLFDIEDAIAAPTPAMGDRALFAVAPRAIVRRTVALPDVESAQIEAYRARTMADRTTPDGRPDREQIGPIEAAWDSTGFARTWPAFDALLWDDAGRLWVGRVSPDTLAPRSWDVHADDGTLIGSVELPTSMRVHAVTGDMVWGTVRDELDVTYVKGYRVQR
jgi:hypothetical protein